MDIALLKNKFSGQVITPADSDYDQARTIFYGGIDKKPAMIIRPVTTDEVVRVINLANENNLELAVRSGGHSVAGHCTTEGGIVLDLRDMKKLDVDPKTKTAWMDAGLTAGEVTAELDKQDLALGFGDTSSVGIGGITLGGGVGYLSRKWGLTIDQLLAAEVVTADGKVHQTDAEHEPDLFWAIRGGGGNFGVVTRFKFQLQSLSQVLGGMLFLPATPVVLAKAVEIAVNAPDELSVILNLMPAPPMPFLSAEHHGKLVIMALVMYAGDSQNGNEVVAPLRTLAKPLADLIRPMRYKDMFPPEDHSFHPTAVAANMFMDRVDLETATVILHRLEANEAPMRVVQLRVLGGAIERIPVEATAYAHRKSKIMTNIAAFYDDPDTKVRRQQWVDETAAALRQTDPGMYVNFLGVDEGSLHLRNVYPRKTWNRLMAIKVQYDPTNVFRLNHNISPITKIHL